MIFSLITVVCYFILLYSMVLLGLLLAIVKTKIVAKAESWQTKLEKLKNGTRICNQNQNQI